MHARLVMFTTLKCMSRKPRPAHLDNIFSRKS
jgi:hypothetical protein